MVDNREFIPPFTMSAASKDAAKPQTQVSVRQTTYSV